MPQIHPHLPSEIIQSEVLSRLPARSVGRLRCVCKAWNSFTSTSTFAQIHLRYQTNYKLLLLHPYSQTFCTYDCEPQNHDPFTTATHVVPFNDNVLTLASLDGLVCVALTKTQKLAFWNPVTGAYKKFGTRFYDDICNGTLAFYIDSSHDYKLLHIVSQGAFIYSWRLSSWSKINTPSKVGHFISNFTWFLAAFSGEKVYFKLESKTIKGKICVMIFDVESNEFKRVKLPPLPCERLDVALEPLNGSIGLCVAYEDSHKSLKYDMWRMDGDEWMKVMAFSRRGCNRVELRRQMHIEKNVNWSREHKGAIYVETLVSPTEHCS